MCCHPPILADVAGHVKRKTFANIFKKRLTLPGAAATLEALNQELTMYQVLDIQTKMVLATFATAKQARSLRDRKDAAYGAVRYVVRFVEVA